MYKAAFLLCLLCLGACTPPGDISGPVQGILYSLQDRLYYIDPDGEGPVSLSERLDVLSALPAGGADEWASISPDGEWLLVCTERFGLQGWAGLVLLPADLSSWTIVYNTNHEAIHPGFSAVANGGRLIILQQDDELYVLTNTGSQWEYRLCLTTPSPMPFHGNPRISPDSQLVLFDGGPTAYGQEGSGLYRIGTDGGGFTNLAGPLNYPGADTNNSLRCPAFAPDGSVVFEADWEGEQIWRLVPGSTNPTVINPVFANDNSPTVLSDGRIVSLWLGRPGGSGLHELKIMNADGSGYRLLVTGQDITDLGLSAGP